MRRWTEQKLWSHSGEEEGMVSLRLFSLIHGQLSPSFPNHALLYLLHIVITFLFLNPDSFLYLVKQQASNIISISTFLLTCAKQHLNYIFFWGNCSSQEPRHFLSAAHVAFKAKHEYRRNNQKRASLEKPILSKRGCGSRAIRKRMVEVGKY